LFELDQVEKLLSALQAPALSVHPQYCSRLRHRLSGCSACSDHCPTKAIAWTGGILSVDPDKCTSCGTCSSACPNGVFDALKPSNLEIIDMVKATLLKQPEVIIACSRSVVDRSANEEVVPCLNRLDEGILVACVALGAKSVLLSRGSCQGCKNNLYRDKAAEVVNNVNKLQSPLRERRITRQESKKYPGANFSITWRKQPSSQAIHWSVTCSATPAGSQSRD
jgi:Fe-S-cluster-containing hydrogenase component 2